MRRVALIALLLALHAEVALACSCGERPAPAEAFADAHRVFTGRVIDAEDRATLLRRAWSFVRRVLDADETLESDAKTHGILYEFEVAQTWRGTPAKRMNIFTGRGDGDCGIPFQRGRTYLVYAVCDGDDCYAFGCGRTQRIEDAADDLAWLRQHVRPAR